MTNTHVFQLIIIIIFITLNYYSSQLDIFRGKTNALNPVEFFFLSLIIFKIAYIKIRIPENFLNKNSIIKKRIGHNFPSEYIPQNHFLSEYKSVCKYVIGVSNPKDLAHELAHAKFYLDLDYKNKIINDCRNRYSNIVVSQKYSKVYKRILEDQTCVE